MPVLSITGATAPCSTPPSVVNSFWNSISTTAVFAVDRVDQVPKDAFPTDRVYGPTPGPELRLITCGGSFDRDAGSYRDNTVVYANQIAPATGP